MLYYFNNLNVYAFLKSMCESLKVIFNKFKDKDEFFVCVNDVVDSIWIKFRKNGILKAYYLTMLGCWSSFRRAISLIAVLGIPSSSDSRRIFLRANSSLDTLSEHINLQERLE